MIDAERVFPNHSGHTHMPFFDGETLLFCVSDHVTQRTFTGVSSLARRLPRNPRLREHFREAMQGSRVSYRAWKLHYCSWGDRHPIPIKTGLPADAVECSPYFYRTGGRVHVSFVGGVPTNRAIGFRLYTMEGPSFAELSPPRPIGPAGIQFGFVSERYICWSEGDGLRVQERADGPARYVSHSFARLNRISCLAENPQKLLITGATAARAHRTLLYDMKSGEGAEVAASVPVYKCSIFGNKLIVAVASDSGTEPYNLFVTLYKLRGSQIEDRKAEQSSIDDTPVVSGIAG